MTTIAWDGVTLAGDRQATFGTTPRPSAKKVFKVEHTEHGAVLFGMSGLASDCQAFANWVFNGGDKPEFKEIWVIAVDQKRNVWYCDNRLMFGIVRSKFWAGGTGADYALGAMAAGKSAVEAVKIASTLDINTGNGFDRVTF